MATVRLASVAAGMSSSTRVATAAAFLTTGTDYYVAPSGSDANSGSLQSPFATIDKAMGASGATIKNGAGGSTINLLAGEHVAPGQIFRSPTTLRALEPVTMRPNSSHGAWALEIVGGHEVWHAPLLKNGIGRIVTATWQPRDVATSDVFRSGRARRRLTRPTSGRRRS